MHSTRQYENNRAEASHQPTRQRERQMRGFASVRHAQRFRSVHGIVLNLFRVGRHLLRAIHHGLLRARAFTTWREATCVPESLDAMSTSAAAKPARSTPT